MRIVLDTNVLVSGLLSAQGPRGQTVGLLVEGVLRPCMDDRMLREYVAVLARPELGIDAEDAAAVVGIIRGNAEMLTPLPLDAELPDAGDQPFLETAAAAKAVLVTGNIRHFPVHARAGVTVVTPREFVEYLRKAR